MSITMHAHDHKDWEVYKLADYGDFSECISECNVRDDYADSTAGDWFYVPDETLTNEQGTFRVIYYGSWSNYNSPGASHYTHAELYDVADEDDMEQFEKDKSHWEGLPESIESDDEEEYDDEDDWGGDDDSEEDDE